MKKFVIAASAAALFATSAVLPARAAPAPIYLGAYGGTTFASGAWFPTSIIAIATLAMTYDLGRRTTCAGDTLNLGGPGFSSKIKPTDNVLTPQCRR